MKKRGLFFTFIAVMLFAAMTVLNAGASTFGKSASFDGSWRGDDGVSYDVHNGLITAKTGTVTDDVTTVDGNIATRLTPNASYTGSLPLGLKHTSVAKMKMLLSDIRYIRYYYYYEGDYTGRASIVLPASDFNISKERTIYSLETVRRGSWAYLTFDLNEIFGYTLPGGILDTVYFYPFGDTKVSALDGNDSIYLREMHVWGDEYVKTLAALSNGTLVQKYHVSFVPGRPDTEGTAPETMYVEAGETITLPENTFVREGYGFRGWICSVGSKIYQPGDTYTVELRTRTGGQQTADTDFIANWELLATEEELKDLLPSVKRVANAPYFMGIVDNRKYGSIEEYVQFDGFTTTRFVPDPAGADAKKYNIMIDGYGWNSLPLDLSHYKYMIIPYYFKTDRESASYTPRLNMLGGAEDAGRALTKGITFYDYGGFRTNQWALMVFEFDFENNKSLNPYLKWETNTVQTQMHFYPFGLTKASSLSANEAIYFGDVIFLDYVPETRPEFSKGFISGDGSGTFRPTELMTKAEAVSVIAKLCGHGDAYTPKVSGYSDIDSGDWCFTYVSFLEEKGILIPAEKEKFDPESMCSADEFLSWAVNANAGGNTDTNVFGTLPVSPSSGKYISRAEAVSLASMLINGIQYSHSDAVKYMRGQKIFTDISEDQWYYPAIVLSSVTSVKSTEGGSTKLIDTFIDVPVIEKEFPEELYSYGLAYMEELDKLTEQRIYDIRNTESVYKQKPGGKTVYVSNVYGKGSVNSSSESNPVYVESITEISAFSLAPGDVMLLKRGEVYRGSFEAQAGVTYSAYGDGNKPVIMPSPENGSGVSKWTLDYEDPETGAKIWKYNNERLTDVGGLNLISADGTHFVAYKEIPSYNDGIFYDRNSSEEYDYKKMLDHDLMYVHFANISPVNGTVILNTPNSTAIGPLYLRCDKGNPGKLYPSIEFNSNEHAIRIKGHGVTIDNLCLKYFGRHGISAGTVHNLTVTNCEIGWGGGSIQSYSADGRVTRFGNGVEIYGALVNYTIDNCYVYEIYDAGITHQISSSSGGHYYMEGVYYTNNVLLNSTYNIEYFMSKNNAEFGLQERYMKNVYFTDNITRMAGYGWGVQRPDNAPSNVKGWTHHNLCDNQVYENNIFDRCIDLQNNTTDYTIMTGTSYESSTPYLVNNIFVQVPGRIVMMYHKKNHRTDEDTEELINRIGGDGNKVYFYPDDFADYKHMVFWK